MTSPNATAYSTAKGSVQKVLRYYGYSDSNGNTDLVRFDSKTAGNRSLRNIGSYVPNYTMSHPNTQQSSGRGYSLRPVPQSHQGCSQSVAKLAPIAAPKTYQLSLNTAVYQLSLLEAPLFSSSLFIGAVAELRKATISFVMFVRLSVHMEQLGSHWTGFHEV